MRKLLLLIALLIVSLVLAEGMLYLVLYLTEPPSASLPTKSGELTRELHYGVSGGILGPLVGLFGTPMFTFLLYRWMKNKEWFKKIQEKTQYSITILLVIVISVSTPFFVHAQYKKWKQIQQYEQQLTAEDIYTKWFDNSSRFIVPMKDVSIKVEYGRVDLKMEYDEQAAIRRNIEDDRSLFQHDLISLLRNQVLKMSPYKELKTLTVQVRYKNELYEFDQIPLWNNQNQKPFTVEDLKVVENILSGKMKLTPSNERDETR